nr:hypothetical protein CFP56_72417 [Quercus suber]
MARLQKEKKDKENEDSQVVSSLIWERTSNVSSVVPLGRTRMVSSATEDGRGKHGLAVARPPLIRDRRAKHP